MKKIILGIILILFFIFSCKKNRIYEGNASVLQFTADTLTFDTVFTTVGSITRYFKVINPLKEAVQIDKIRLAGIPGNQFRINVDGYSGTEIENIEIPGKDSIYIFAEVTVNPNNQNEPFILMDEVQYFYNGIQQNSYLRAWGQNAYFHYAEIIEGDSIWENDKPHVVIGNNNFPGVGIEAFGSLTIKPGCKIYFSQNSTIISDGSITIGAAGCQDSVVLQSSRIEDLPNGLNFDKEKGLWLGIILRNGSIGTFNNVCIKNAVNGISGRFVRDDFDLFTVANQPVIIMDKVQIKHSANSALFCLNTKIIASNCLFYDVNSNAAVLALGGDYEFNNCTFNGGGEGESVALSNFASNGSQGGYGDLTKASFTNCIVYGGKNDELLISNEHNASFNFLFENSLIKTSLNTDTTTYVNCIINENPNFVASNEGNYRLNEFSPCIGIGKNIALSNDLYCNTHNTPMDIGAIAYIP